VAGHNGGERIVSQRVADRPAKRRV
jgi:hypothetical protein